MALHGHSEHRRNGESRISLSKVQKARIRDRSLTAYAVAEMANVQPHVVRRFLNGERGLMLTTADKLASVLGLELSPAGSQAPDTMPKRLRER